MFLRARNVGVQVAMLRNRGPPEHGFLSRHALPLNQIAEGAELERHSVSGGPSRYEDSVHLCIITAGCSRKPWVV